MIVDNAFIENASDIVADNVTALPASQASNTLVYLTLQSGQNAPGLYIYSELGAWVFLSNGAVVS